MFKLGISLLLGQSAEILCVCGCAVPKMDNMLDGSYVGLRASVRPLSIVR